MAMLPNLRIGAPPAAPAGQTAEEPAAPDLFARLLALLPNGERAPESTAVTTTVGIDAEGEPAEQDTAEGEEGPEVSIPFLPTFEMQRAMPVLTAAVAAPAGEAQAAAPAPAAPAARAAAVAPPPAAVPSLVEAAVTAAIRGKAPVTPAAAPKDAIEAEPGSSKAVETEAVPEPLRRALRLLQPAAAAADAALPRDEEQAPRPATAGPAATAQPAVPPQPAQQAVSANAQTPLFAMTDAPTQARPAEPLAPLSAEPAAEAAVERQLEVSADGEWLDQLARDIVRSGAGGDGTLRFRLNPETLGQVRVELSQGPEGATIRIGAETEAARSLIAAAEPRLAAEARAQGLRIAETEVSLAGSDAGSADPQRREEAKPEPWLRTARTVRDEAEDEPGRTSSDRYA